MLFSFFFYVKTISKFSLPGLLQYIKSFILLSHLSHLPSSQLWNIWKWFSPIMFAVSCGTLSKPRSLRNNVTIISHVFTYLMVARQFTLYNRTTAVHFSSRRPLTSCVFNFFATKERVYFYFCPCKTNYLVSLSALSFLWQPDFSHTFG